METETTRTGWVPTWALDAAGARALSADEVAELGFDPGCVTAAPTARAAPGRPKICRLQHSNMVRWLRNPHDDGGRT